jgi:hypothetical protein
MGGEIEVAGDGAGFLADVLLGEEHVDGRDDQQGEEGSEGHAGDDGQADGIAGGGARAGHEHEGEMAADGGGAGHEDGAQANQGRLADRFEFAQTGSLELVGKLDDEDAVLGNEPDECHEATCE